MTHPSMQYRSLGQCGTRVSVFGLGGWTTFGDSVNDERTVRDIITNAFDSGINFFDIADVYNRGQSEIAMGRVLRELPRHQLVISTKVYFPMSDDVNDRGLSRKHIIESVDKSLQRIGIDYLDIYFCHRYDPDTPLDETVRAMDDLIHQGKILYWGTSEWTGGQLQEAHKLANFRNLHQPQIEQPQYSLLFRSRFESDVAPAATELGMGIVVWSPLASGLLTGKYDDGIPSDARLGRIDWLRENMVKPERLDRVRHFGQLASELGASRAQLALAWAASYPAVSSVILGVTRREQLCENLDSLSIDMTDDLRSRLSDLFPTAERAA